MFLRKNRKRFADEVYEYWTLCEMVRTERGPRERVVASLGKYPAAAKWIEAELIRGERTIDCAPSPNPAKMSPSDSHIWDYTCTKAPNLCKM